jgi:hypothetical protein
MDYFPASPAGRSSLDSGYQYPDEFPSHTSAVSSATSLDGQENDFDYMPNGMQNPWSYDFKSTQSYLVSPVISPGTDQQDHDFFSTQTWNSQAFSLDASTSLDSRSRGTNSLQKTQVDDFMNRIDNTPASSYQDRDTWMRNFASEHSIAETPGFGYGLTSGISSSSEEESTKPTFKFENILVNRQCSITGDIYPEAGNEAAAGTGQIALGSSETAQTHQTSCSWTGHDGVDVNHLRSLGDGDYIEDVNFMESCHGSREIPHENHNNKECRPENPAKISPSSSSILPLNPSLDSTSTKRSTKIKPPTPKRITSSELPVTCKNCFTQNTPLWRRGAEGIPMCNACGLFRRLHGTDRPLSLKTDVIKKRKRSGFTNMPAGEGRSGTKHAERKGKVGEVMVMAEEN